jgi:hypothetical protein
MERSSRFISLSGLSGVSAGIMALLGGCFTFFFLNFDVRYFDVNRYFSENLYRLLPGEIYTMLIVAGVILITAIFFAVLFTTRRAKRKGLKVWTRTTRMMLIALAIPLGTGGIFCVFLLYYRLIFLIAPSTLIFYGLALLNASKFTLNEIQWLGISEISIGLISCFFTGYGLIFWMLGFGILHIVYGAFMYFRYERILK